MRRPTHRHMRASAYLNALAAVTLLLTPTSAGAATPGGATPYWTLPTISTIGGVAAVAILVMALAFALLRRRWRQADRDTTRHWDNNALSTALWAGKNDLLNRRVTSAEQSTQWCADYEQWRRDVDRLLERGYSVTERETFRQPTARSSHQPIKAYDIAHEQRRNFLAAQIESLRYILMHSPS